MRELVSDEDLFLPLFPPAARRLGAIVSRDDFSFAELTNVVRSDEVLSATAVRYANSAAIAGRGGVASVDAAVSRIGARQIVRLAFASGIGRECIRSGPLIRLRRRVWRRALFSAEICRELAPLRELAPDVAFTSGLLHDFGEVVAIGCLEQILRAIPGAMIPEACCASLIADHHVELGARVAREWGLGRGLVHAIECHHDPKPREELHQLLATVDQLVAATEDPGGSTEPCGLLAPHERSRVEPLLRSLPKLLTGLEAAMGGEAASETEVQPRAEPSLAGSQVVGELEVVIDGEATRTAALFQGGMVVETTRRPSEESLVEVTVEVASQHHPVWCVVRRREVVGSGRVRLALSPLGMDGPARRTWRMLLAVAAA